MHVLAKAVLALTLTSLLLLWSLIGFLRARSVPTALQFLGAAGAVTVALTHLFEAQRLFPSMHWGQPHSPGHYVDLSSAILALTLFPLGYVLHALRRRRHQ